MKKVDFRGWFLAIFFREVYFVLTPLPPRKKFKKQKKDLIPKHYVNRKRKEKEIGTGIGTGTKAEKEEKNKENINF